MSYILDALKKADSQRERDPARGIHAQPVPPSSRSSRSGEGLRVWIWGAGAVGLAAAGTIAWYAQRDENPVVARTLPAATAGPLLLSAPAPAAAVVAVVEPAPVATALMPPAPPPAPVVTDDEPRTLPRRSRGRGQQVAAAAAASAPGAAFGAAPPAAGAIPGAAPAPGIVAPAAGVSATAPGAAVPARPPAPPPVAVNPPPPPPPPRAPVTVPTPPVAGLPADAPKLVITGGVYSTNPTQRMLIVNGQVMNQGADLGSGVTLEEIKPKAAVLMFRGARYTIGY